LDLTKPATWISLTLAILVIGFVLHQIGMKVPQVATVNKASFGS
jgi:uncharacterized membrane protein YidH (DUF202 family)